MSLQTQQKALTLCYDEMLPAIFNERNPNDALPSSSPPSRGWDFIGDVALEHSQSDKKAFIS